MEIASTIFSKNFDPGILEQIDTLRTIRLTMAENMLRDLSKTADELVARGLMEQRDDGALKKELQDRISVLKERMSRPDVVYADEISMYVDMLENDIEIEGDGDEAGH
jgi:hypothetical protein